mmetsp:Transcript_18767/g.42466  ORF Transcript_18767/g.42466 Transcript_18767/m.42466 type:complete len:701 (-) Transcript_18767:41-2143(-)
MKFGIIKPPPEIRAVVDRTALFVSKNGRAFELKILNSDKGKTTKFAFLDPASPFHGYYESKIKFYEDGGNDEEEKRKEEEEKKRKQREAEEAERALKEKEEAEAALAARKEAARKKASAADPVARALLASRANIQESQRRQSSEESKDGGETKSGNNGPRPPPALMHVSLAAPANLTQVEVEVIKLTAKFVALSSDKNSAADPLNRSDNFLSALSLREWANPEFGFLQPRHANFAYFTALADAYRSFLPGGEDYEAAKSKMRMDARKKRLADLIDDETSDNSTPLNTQSTVQNCLESAAYRAEYERDMAQRRRDAAEDSGGLGGAGIIDWHDFVVVETIEFKIDEKVEAVAPPTSLRLAALTQDLKAGGDPTESSAKDGGDSEGSSSEDSMDMEDDDDNSDDGEKLKVVQNYQPKVVSTQQITGSSSRTHIIDPISGKSIPIADMPEHMRIQLLDPKWAEEKKRFMEKQQDTNFVQGEDIASNISRFASQRGVAGGDADGATAAAKPLPDIKMGPGLPGEMPPPSMAADLPPPPAAPTPASAVIHVTQPTSDEPDAKRLKVDPSATNLPGEQFSVPETTAPTAPPPKPEAPAERLSEAAFIATLSTPDELPFCVRIPHDPSSASWNLNGQTIDLTMAATCKIKELKEKIREELGGGMPTNKMQIKHPSFGFMKDVMSLAYFNIGPMTSLDLVPKKRGGRK